MFTPEPVASPSFVRVLALDALNLSDGTSMPLAAGAFLARRGDCTTQNPRNALHGRISANQSLAVPAPILGRHAWGRFDIPFLLAES